MSKYFLNSKTLLSEIELFGGGKATNMAKLSKQVLKSQNGFAFQIYYFQNL
jgi:hypothetical protein